MSPLSLAAVAWRRSALAALCLLACGSLPAAQLSVPFRAAALEGSLTPASPQALNPPSITIDLPAESHVYVGSELHFEVTVTDPDGDAVSLHLMNPIPGLIFHPIRSAASPATAQVRWLVGNRPTGRQEVVFEAFDDVRPRQRTRSAARFFVYGESGKNSLPRGDVTGDGIPDVVASASNLFNDGSSNVGGILVWEGGRDLAGSPAPRAILTPPQQCCQDLGVGVGNSIQLGDVTGDGILDVITVSFQRETLSFTGPGKVFVWQGGSQLQGTLAPTAQLEVPGAPNQYRLGESAFAGDALLLEDLNKDGVLDVIAHSDGVLGIQGGQPAPGGVHIWFGGSGLSGSVAAHANLTVPGLTGSDRLGSFSGQGVQLADVTGDGYLDVVVASPHANGFDGAIHVWSGGPALSGDVDPNATLLPAAGSGDFLGLTSGGVGVRLADISGDGVLDIIAVASFADQPGATDAGAIHVWAGGPAITGTRMADAVLQVSQATTGDRLGRAGGALRGFQLAEVTGDGLLDVIAQASLADRGALTDVGAAYVWKGRTSWAGILDPSATLQVDSPTAGDQLGQAGEGTPGIQIGDVSGDGTNDLIVGAYLATVSGVAEAGAIYVWNGGPELDDVQAPRAVLTVPGAVAGDRLGDISGWGIQLVDVTGDGRRDIVAGASSADVGGIADVGAVYVWAGGNTLSGPTAPTKTLYVPGAVAGDQLGEVERRVQGMLVADVSDDGVLDVVVASSRTDVGGIVDTGAVHVWFGGGATGPIAPSATLTVPGAAAGDRLGDLTTAFAGALRMPFQLVDVDGDGILDVLAHSIRATVSGVSEAGALYLWSGGASLSGATDTRAIFAVPGASPGDQLGRLAGHGVVLLDVTGDGRLDLVTAAFLADIGVVTDAGSVYAWTRNHRLSSMAAPSATLQAPVPRNGDFLGF